ncbi:Arc family DNA-binding protein [Xylella fastidiosa]
MRVSQNLKDWLATKAAENMRSLNSEIVHRLEESRKREAERATG